MSGGDVRPGMVNFVLTTCEPNAAAYQATILDLAARGFLTVRDEPGGLRVALAGAPGGAAALADYEQQVLGDIRARLGGTGSAPFEALAQACTLDVRGIWDPFKEKLVAEARRRGICRSPRWATTRPVLTFFAVTAAVAALAALATTQVRPSAGIGGALGISAAAVIVSWWFLGWLAEDRLTGTGSALAAGWQREREALAAAGVSWNDPAPTALHRRAFAIAAGIPGAAPGPPGPGQRRAGGLRAGPPPEKRERPAELWSSFSGTWRQVTPELSRGLRHPGAEPGIMFALAGVAFLLTLLAVWMGLTNDPLRWVAGQPALVLAATAATLTAVGVHMRARRSSVPKTATFDGQVIGRWQEVVRDSEGSGRVPCTAVDDGERAWIFSEAYVYNYVAVGDLVQVTVSPRSGALLRLTVTARARAEGAGGNPAP
jgi:hypothetical protein